MCSKPVSLVLASASPRRGQLLRQIGVCYRPMPVDVDESVLDGEAPEDYVTRLALAKAHAGWRQAADVPVMGADTAVVCNGQILGKPRNKKDAMEMLSLLSNNSHRVLTAVAVVKGDSEQVRLVATGVEFRAITPQECEAYWETGEPCDKAGSYGIQGLGAIFVSRITGSYSAVVGLPLAETAQLLTLFKVPVWQAIAIEG